jgi:hypothetical protein
MEVIFLTYRAKELSDDPAQAKKTRKDVRPLSQRICVRKPYSGGVMVESGGCFRIWRSGSASLRFDRSP